MGIEIERKFLLKSTSVTLKAKPIEIIQGYLHSDDNKTIRIRIAGLQAFITIKSRVRNLSRQEFEYNIPIQDARAMLKLCNNLVIKKRYNIEFEKHIWEVDEFLGDNAGLFLAEIELSCIDEHFAIPDWIGKEVSEDWRYCNSNLAKNPYKNWNNER